MSLIFKADKFITSDVDTKFGNLLSTAPAALNTLSELANALGNDATYASTVVNMVGLKANQATTHTDTNVDTAILAIALTPESQGIQGIQGIKEIPAQRG